MGYVQWITIPFRQDESQDVLSAQSADAEIGAGRRVKAAAKPDDYAALAQALHLAPDEGHDVITNLRRVYAQALL